MKEVINHPEHYKPGIYEAINVIEAWNLNFCLGNSLKYICRAGKKDPSKVVEDLKKAHWYLNREIETRHLSSVVQPNIPVDYIKEMPGSFSPDKVVKAWELNDNLRKVVLEIADADRICSIDDIANEILSYFSEEYGMKVVGV